jgi:branched-chain amino acid transport system ATP-binding protein
MVENGALREGDTLLRLDDVYMYFGGVAALSGVSLDVKKGEIHSIIGPNGAGKTVMMNCINGLYRPQRGTIHYKGNRSTTSNPTSVPAWAFRERSRRSSSSAG